MMPKTLTLVRHGESESNAAKRFAEKGSPHPNEAPLMQTHTSRRRLTPRGVRQSTRAGEWLRKHFESIDCLRDGCEGDGIVGFVSPYIRAMETAGHMRLPIQWRADARLAERNWGDMDQLTYEERVARYGETHNREHHGIFWPAGNGETLQMLGTRIWQHFDMLNRQHSDVHVVEVSHGETMLVQRFMLERWMPEDVVKMMLATDTRFSKEVLGAAGPDNQNKIINCRIVQYTREREDGNWDTKYCRVRLVAPSDPTNPGMNLDWQPIVRKQFSSEALLQYVTQFPRYLDDG
jgi:broad specificity phosphatase PhoE